MANRKENRTKMQLDAQEFAQMVEEQAGTDDWTRILYDVAPKPEPSTKLVLEFRSMARKTG
jgi:hypothetical protein